MPLASKTIEFEVAKDDDVLQDVVFGPVCTIAGLFDGLAPGRAGTVAALRGDVDLTGLVTVEDIQAYLPEAQAITHGQVECDAAGQYVVRGLSTGTYTLVAVAFNPVDEEDISQWRWTAQVVTLQEDGETLTMDFDFR